MPNAIEFPERTLAEKVEEYTLHEAAVHKKLICCPPDDSLSALMDLLLPHISAMHKICEEAVG